MDRHKPLFCQTIVILAACVVGATVNQSLAATPDSALLPTAGDLSFSLDNVYAGSSASSGTLLQEPEEEETISEETTITTYDESDSWDLKGPYYLRSADPLEAGMIDLKFIYGYQTTSDGTDDDNDLAFALEWGMTEDITMYVETGLRLGDGKVEGNADIKAFGFHTRFWREDGWIPAVAMRNEMRIPTGYHSSGVDYEARLLVTKSIVPGTFRAHFNPFLRLVNGENSVEHGGHNRDWWGWGCDDWDDHDCEPDPRHFQWGLAAGVDWRLTEDLVLIADYLHRSSIHRGDRNQHIFEFGADWKLAENHMLAFGSEVGLDGDSQEANWGMKIAYIFSFNAFRLDAPSSVSTSEAEE